MEEDHLDAMEESCPELEAIYAGELRIYDVFRARFRDFDAYDFAYGIESLMEYFRNSILRFCKFYLIFCVFLVEFWFGELVDMEMMKERFAKLLLGEDMSGGGKGVSSALALSNAITNLAASVFGEISRLEPMPPDGKARWRKEIDWLLSVTDHIVEFVPSKQNTNGIIMEIMVTRQRSDVHVNIPALKKLDVMLMECLENFKGQNEFTYASKDDDLSKSKKKRKKTNGGYRLQRMDAQAWDDTIYKNITVDHFDPDYFLSAMDLTSEHKIVDLKNRIEASVVIWRRKMTNKDGKSGWGSGVSLEKREQFEDRAETILLILKHRYPGIPQSALDVSKIEHNRDVGHAILESYSRILESLAHKVMSRIEDVIHADNLVQNPSGRRKAEPAKRRRAKIREIPEREKKSWKSLTVQTARPQ
ncbi:hypothetical protein OSB04_004809 [Centaurea solstitialis]|uniref:PRONE domain-containing protein n=1 Tax=Centaurea solstitialis TaxID=347529 RepID=A0AA38TET9_9ASTR|nr:hypothetical protein OSB04_004809 [Centaurea solstitialis]